LETLSASPSPLLGHYSNAFQKGHYYSNAPYINLNVNSPHDQLIQKAAVWLLETVAKCQHSTCWHWCGFSIAWWTSDNRSSWTGWATARKTEEAQDGEPALLWAGLEDQVISLRGRRVRFSIYRLAASCGRDYESYCNELAIY
jgi:hypothetical protein